jgi:hypothetical protein
MFVDNAARVVYGQRYIDDYDRGQAVQTFVADVMTTIHTVYQTEAARTARPNLPPPAAATLAKIHAAITSKVASRPRS